MASSMTVGALRIVLLALVSASGPIVPRPAGILPAP